MHQKKFTVNVIRSDRGYRVELILEDCVAAVTGNDQVQRIICPLWVEVVPLRCKMIDRPSSPVGEITDEIAAKRTLIALVRKCPFYELFDHLSLS